jgi:hypothetical protein
MTSLRKENLRFLVKEYGSQSALARAIAPSNLTQPIISQMLNKQRRIGNGRMGIVRGFNGDEARSVERQLGIPHFWMDKYSFDLAWPHIKQFQKLSPEIRNVVGSLIDFVSGNRSA